jgi:hypothetical protein
LSESLTIQRAILKATYLTDSQRSTLISRVENELHEAQYPDFSGKPISVYIDGMTSFYAQHPQALGLNFGEIF